MTLRPLIGALMYISPWLLGTVARAQAPSDSRQAIIEHYVDHKKKNPAIYQSPPITHIVPAFNTISYAVNIGREKMTLYPSDDLGNMVNSPNSSSTLQTSGYDISPHLAMSLKRVGLGFSVESMHRAAVYSKLSSYYEGGGGEGVSQVTASETQRSSVDASGYGFNISLLPFPRLPKWIQLATILGIKSLSAKHAVTPSETASSSPSAPAFPSQTEAVYRYNVQKYEVGINLSLQLLKGFSVIPWVDYTETSIQSGIAIKSAASTTTCTDYECDLQLFWHDSPKLRYGVDVGVNVGGFEVRIGGLLGTLANLNATPSFIDDNTLAISLSWDQKGD